MFVFSGDAVRLRTDSPIEPELRATSLDRGTIRHFFDRLR
jgi:hypothetical protein